MNLLIFSRFNIHRMNLESKESFIPELLPGKGLASASLGAGKAEVVDLFGIPDETEFEEDEDLFIDAAIYSDLGIVFFYAPSGRLNALEFHHKGSLLWGEKVMNMSIEQMEGLLKSKAFKDIQIEKEPWGETRIGVPSAGLEFYFENNQLNAINLSEPHLR
jgi:hypothetical protein